MQMQWMVGLFLAVLITVFALQNTAPVTVTFLFFALEGVALALVILVTAAAAAGATGLLGVARLLRHRAETEQLRRDLAQRDAEAARLQAQAAAPQARIDDVAGPGSGSAVSDRTP